MVHVSYPSPTAGSLKTTLTSAKQLLPTVNLEFGLIVYGLSGDDVAAVNEFALSSVELKAFIHYCPSVDNGVSLLVKNASGEYLPSVASVSCPSELTEIHVSAMFHLAASQEKLYASLLPLTESSSLSYRLKTSVAHPISVHTYPLVPAAPVFPLLAKAPASIIPGENAPVDPHVLSATNMSYTKTLSLLRKELGPHFDLEKIWGQHLYYVCDKVVCGFRRYSLRDIRNSRNGAH